MCIITISRGSYSRGKEVAEKVCLALGYECISRDIILETSEQFNIPELRLVRAIHDSPSILDRFTRGKQRFVSFFRAALLKHVQKDNVVYHGLAGQFLLQGIPHVLKVRIIADMEDRVKEEMRREKISAEEARRVLVKDDEERRKWSHYLYGVDAWDPRLYDVVIHVKKMSVDDAVSILLHAVQLPCFQTTPKGQKVLDDLALSAQVEAVLVKDFPKVEVDAKQGEVLVSIRASLIDEKVINAKVKDLTQGIDGAKTVHVNIVPFVIED